MKLSEMKGELGCTGRRVQIWSAAGLLGKQAAPGTGTHREYDEREVERARVLNLLSDLGVTIGIQAKLIDHLLCDHKSRSVLEHLRQVTQSN